jgi:hypothetical protein
MHSRLISRLSLWEAVCHGPALLPIALGVSAVGTLVQTAGALRAGQDADRAAKFDAAVKEQEAQRQRAVGQREMLQERQKKDLAQSRLQALAASSGGGATDASVIDLMEGIETQGEVNSLMKMWAGENTARGYEDAAMAARLKGQAEKTGSRYKAAGTLLSGAGDLFSKYKSYG